MQKVILDTNVLVSGLIQKSYPYLILNEFLTSDNIILCVSDELLAEYYDVLNRKKFARYPEFILHAKLLLATIEIKALKYFPKTKVTLIADQADNRLLELAAQSKAKFLITGNT